jgi:hypothetical protein
MKNYDIPAFPSMGMGISFTEVGMNLEDLKEISTLESKINFNHKIDKGN